MTAIESESYRRHDVPADSIQKWQKTVDLMAANFDVPAGLIMRVLPSQLEVLVASNSSENPYKLGEKADLKTGLYCETVMAKRKQLVVPSALEDPEWKHNPDVALNMTSYMGMPLICPDGSVFGTICVLDDHTRNDLPIYGDLLREFRGIIEQDLRMLEQERQLRLTNERLTHELAVARELSKVADREHEAVLLGESIAVRSLRESILVHAQDVDPLLLIGPSGARQEAVAVARSLHGASPRASRPFIYVDVSHLDSTEDSLFDNRLDASGERLPGKASLADGGTLYLEGIDRLSESAQSSLLQFLKDAAAARSAGNRPVPDVRVVAYSVSSLSDEVLESKVREGEFLEDLYKWLNSSSVTIPPLRARKEDIPLLAKYFADRVTARIGRLSVDFSKTALTRLLSHSWPGNIRELSNVIERIVVSTRGSVLEIDEGILGEGVPLGSYRLVERLGSGGMGEVWLARHKLLARPAAVKLIRPEALGRAANVHVIERFEREAQVTATLKSPHTVQLHDFGISETGVYYYVMELLTGMDLNSMVQQFGPVSTERTVLLLRQVCRSLSEAHEADLVHRDIKPANLYVCKLGPDYDFLKVLDFGMVKAPVEKEASQLTATGSTTGTPAFIAPELALGDVEVDGRADIYALGCVAYWLLTGMLVFESDSPIRMMMDHANKKPEPPSRAAEVSIPNSLDELVLACLEKAPKDRPSSASELWSILGEIKFDEPWDQICAQRWWKLHKPDLAGTDGRA